MRIGKERHVMNQMHPVAAKADAAPPHFDVLIVGAGISGVGSAWHLQQQCPWASYAILEMKDTFCGTWDTHKYPGVRSESDLYTFGYRFKPCIGRPIPSIGRESRMERVRHDE